jgi:hypothetical protein
MFCSCLGVESMRFSTVDEDIARTGLADEAATARKVKESVAIHAALGPIAVETRLKELDREIAAQKGGRDPHIALLLSAFGHGGSTSRRRFLSCTAGAGLLAWLVAPRWPDKFRPLRSRELLTTHEIQQECVALLKLKHEWS